MNLAGWSVSEAGGAAERRQIFGAPMVATDFDRACRVGGRFRTMNVVHAFLLC